MNQYLIRAALVSVALVATPAAAAPKETYVATLSGGQLVPVVTTMASGSALLRLNDKKLEVSVSFYDLSSPLAAAHIHCCAIAGANAGVAIDFDPDPMTSGTFTSSCAAALRASWASQCTFSASQRGPSIRTSPRR